MAGFFHGIYRAQDSSAALAVIAGLVELDISDVHSPEPLAEADAGLLDIVACLLRAATSLRRFRAAGLRQLAACTGVVLPCAEGAALRVAPVKRSS